jgi:hypothetical protein
LIITASGSPLAQRNRWIENIGSPLLSAQRELARRDQHRAVGVADLLTATLAAAHHLIVVHYDADFETAATVLAFQRRWVLPRESLQARHRNWAQANIHADDNLVRSGRLMISTKMDNA